MPMPMRRKSRQLEKVENLYRSATDWNILAISGYNSGHACASFRPRRFNRVRSVSGGRHHDHFRDDRGGGDRPGLLCAETMIRTESATNCRPAKYRDSRSRNDVGEVMTAVDRRCRDHHDIQQRRDPAQILTGHSASMKRTPSAVCRLGKVMIPSAPFPTRRRNVPSRKP